jgi:hypothetical protein
MDQPPTDPAKLLVAWVESEKEENPPGQAVADLETGGLRDGLEHLVVEQPGPSA